MKLDPEFVIRTIVGEELLVPVGKKVIEFKGIMTLTPVGAYIYRKLQEDKTYNEILDAVLTDFEIDKDTAESDLKEFLDNLKKLGILNDE